VGQFWTLVNRLCCPKTPPSPHRGILIRDLAFVAQSGGTKRPLQTEALIRMAMKAASVIRSPDDRPDRIRVRLPSPQGCAGLAARCGVDARMGPANPSGHRAGRRLVPVSGPELQEPDLGGQSHYRAHIGQGHGFLACTASGSKSMAEPKTVRCVVYTRKSSEEGLEQAFNSLDAQREAGIAYITSQKHEGWVLAPTHYDDGGYSGGSTERPALQKLLVDIEAGKVDIIVVYKVDRLSRSLGDFAQMMTLFDKHNVSFVSVTQQFNTTTSMGRLTLNILLSFAQFEREVTGERIRDKFAASKKKGMWMGGSPPLGYVINDRQLIIEPQEAELVKKIFNLYLTCQSPLAVMQTLQQDGHTNKHWQTAAGHWRGGNKMTVSHVNKILRNVVYVGKVQHGKDSLSGAAPADH
jgi:DNA invertase Pin-like site-specific DNA recombinase